MKTICTDKAPAAIGPYSQGKISGGQIYLSGAIALDPQTGEIVGTDIEGQTHQVIANIDALLKAAGISFDSVVKTTCFLADMADFAKFNEIYTEHFTSKPARSCVAVKTLPKNLLVEIEVVAEIEG